MDFFTSGKYDFIIVGGGISGLFLAYKLSSIEKFKILLIEKTGRLGGRIHTYESKQHNIKYETGAARFNINHTKLISLIKELGLEGKISELPIESDSVLRNNAFDYPYYLADPKLELDYNALMEKVIHASDKMSKAYLINISFFQLCVDIIGFEGATFLKDSFGYSGEFLKGNADSMIDIFKKNFLDESQQYYLLDDGLSEIIHKLHAKLKSRSNVTIKLNTIIEDVNLNTCNYYYVETIDKKYHYSSNIILTIPQKSLLELSIFNKGSPATHWLKSVSPVPLCRIYALYDKCWYKDIPKTTTDNNIRYFIPINYNETGGALAMISYSDSDDAIGWHNTYKVSREQLLKNVHAGLEEIFPENKISKSKYHNLHFWEAGIHLWNMGANSGTLYKHILKPFKDKKLYIAGECYSLNQGWIEGALESAYDILLKLDLGDKYELYTHEPIELGEEEVEKEEEEEEKKEVVPLKTFKINDIKAEMKKKTPIIIFDLGKLPYLNDTNKYVYSVKGWLSKHPGGPDNIERGINANRYYLDDPEYNDGSPIDLFLSIDNHKGDLENIIGKYLINDNSYVKKIGVFLK